MRKVFYNPKVKDKVTVLETAEDTNGDYILVEVELAPGGGTPRHFHTTFSETFISVEGTLGVDMGKKKFRLHPSQYATAHIKEIHRFYNPGKETIRFHVKISPAQNRFLESLCIGYGLADDGLTNKKGIPKKFDHLAVLMEHSDTRFTGSLPLSKFSCLDVPEEQEREALWMNCKSSIVKPDRTNAYNTYYFNSADGRISPAWCGWASQAMIRLYEADGNPAKSTLSGRKEWMTHALWSQ